nr:N-acetylated-alpha-linked acidic dipeptidase 2-like isoform X1 [Cherax quadricarinatus]XP_053650514.1 N-acetylated-alpha-linked acidic dipeptidase 2-like isoform X1 [Cherax quadricarinatus]
MVGRQTVLTVVAGAVCLVIGGLVGHYCIKNLSSTDKEKIRIMEELVADKWDSESELNHKIMESINRDNLRTNLKELSRLPHLAGTERDHQLARMIRDKFMEAGFDTADLVPYDVLLSRPNHTNPNLVTLEDGEGRVVFSSAYKEKLLLEEEDQPDSVHAFNGFTPAGEVRTESGRGLVYANYARVEDFDRLEELNVSVRGCVVIARYGKIFRGNKLVHAEKRGAIGLILFSDPNDVALEGQEKEAVYPNTWWLPGSGIERGSTFLISGDPLTPGWPSTAQAYRLKIEDIDLHKIPCQPIGYDDARVILGKIGGTPAPSDAWKGGLAGVEYNLGPELKNQFSSYILRLSTHNVFQVYRSYNVIGTIRGKVEPDRYIMIGNHRDSWVYGASDPSSGTAQMLETARVLGQLISSVGWRPRRTLVFCSWGAEEYGLIGSTEWVEEHVNKLQERAVMYLNTDTCAAGPIINVPSSPLLWDPLTTIMKLVPGVRDGATIYDEWRAHNAAQNRNQTSPEMRTLGSGSDYDAFYFLCGIPCVDFRFRRDKNKYDISRFPAYHSGYDTFYMVDKNIDPGFRIHQGCSRIASLLLKYFADSLILPYSLQHLPKVMQKTLDVFRESGKRDKLMKICGKYSVLEESLENFTDAVTTFVRHLEEERLKNLDPVSIRAINDQMMKIEQVFILPIGLPGRPNVRHAVFAPSQFDYYSTSCFPGITDLLYGMEDLSGRDRLMREDQIKRHVSDLTIMIQRASSYLRDFHVI